MIVRFQLSGLPYSLLGGSIDNTLAVLRLLL